MFVVFKASYYTSCTFVSNQSSGIGMGRPPKMGWNAKKCQSEPKSTARSQVAKRGKGRKAKGREETRVHGGKGRGRSVPARRNIFIALRQGLLSTWISSNIINFGDAQVAIIVPL